MTNRAIIIDFLYGVSSDSSGTATANKDNQPLREVSLRQRLASNMLHDEYILYRHLEAGAYKQLNWQSHLIVIMDSVLKSILMIIDMIW